MKKFLFYILVLFFAFANTVSANQEALDKALEIGDKMVNSQSWQCKFAKVMTGKFAYNCNIPKIFSKALTWIIVDKNGNYLAKNSERLGNIFHTDFIKKPNSNCPSGQVVKWIDDEGKIFCDYKQSSQVEIEILEWEVFVGETSKNLNTKLTQKQKYKFSDKLVVENKSTNEIAIVRFLQDDSTLTLESKTRLRLDTKNFKKSETQVYKKISDVLVYNGIIWGRVLSPVNINNNEIVAWVRGTSFLWEQKPWENHNQNQITISDYVENNFSKLKENMGNNDYGLKKGWENNSSENYKITVFDSQNKDYAMIVALSGDGPAASAGIKIPANSTYLVKTWLQRLATNWMAQQLSIINNTKTYKDIFQERTKYDIAYLNRIKSENNKDQKSNENIISEINSTTSPCKEWELYYKDSPIEKLVCIESNVKYFGYRDGKYLYFDVDDIRSKNNNNNNNNKNFILEGDKQENDISVKAGKYGFSKSNVDISFNNNNNIIENCSNGQNHYCYQNNQTITFPNNTNIVFGWTNYSYFKLKNPK